jgi:hypothetical protein
MLVEMRRKTNLELILLLLTLVAGRVIMYLAVGDMAVDPYITYRYAHNLAAGHGLVFNLGEKVQGFSSPLYTLLMAGFALVLGSHALPLISTVVCLSADVLSLLILWRMPFADFPRFLVCSLFALFPKMVLIAVSGMEAPVVVLLMLFSLYLICNQKHRAAFGILGLLLFCRIDSVIWIVTVIVWLLLRRYRITIADVLFLALPYVGWLVCSILYFGTLLPHSVVTKSVSWHHMFPAFDPVRVLMGYFPFRGLEGVSPFIRIAVALTFILPIVVELVRLGRRKEILVIAPAFFLLYNLGFSFGRVVMADWYYYPGYVAYFISLGTLIHRMSQEKKLSFFKYSNLTSAKLGLVFLLTLLLAIGIRRWAEDPGKDFARHREIQKWASEHIPSGSSVLLGEGIAAWGPKVHVHDCLGLVSEQVISYRLDSPGSDRWFFHFLKDFKPDYVALRNWEVPRNALFHGFGDGPFQSESDRQWFDSHYRQVAEFKTETAMDSVYIVFYQHISFPSFLQGSE